MAKTHVAKWELSTSFSFLDPHDRDTDKILPRRTRHTAQFNIARQFGALRPELTVINQGSRYDDVANTTYLSGYTLIDLKVNYALNSDWTMEGKVGNLLDKDYETVAGYNSPGRMVLMGIRYAPH
jgi:vitamin B12 transporter